MAAKETIGFALWTAVGDLFRWLPQTIGVKMKDSHHLSCIAVTLFIRYHKFQLRFHITFVASLNLWSSSSAQPHQQHLQLQKIGSTNVLMESEQHRDRLHEHDEVNKNDTDIRESLETRPEVRVPILRRCLRRLPCCRRLDDFVTSFWQDSVISYYWYHFILSYLACVLFGCGGQFIIIGIYQIIQVNRSLTPEAQSIDLWIKFACGGVLFLTFFILLYGTAYNILWMLYVAVAVGVLNFIGVISGNVLMMYQTSPKELNSMMHKFLQPSPSSGFTQTVNRIHNEFTCCGSAGESDFSSLSERPESCCLNKTGRYFNSTQFATLLGAGQCQQTSPNLNFEGCSVHMQLYRESLLAPHQVFFMLAAILLFFGVSLALCYLPLAKHRKRMRDDEFDEEGLDDPFRRSIVAAAILGQIDDELLADEVLLPAENREILEKFRQRVAGCHSMTGIHRIIEDSIDIIKLIKESGKHPVDVRVKMKLNPIQMEKEKEKLSVRMAGV